ncbi:MAG TPA: dipeptidyl carboxypeptidase II, partial [Saprospiraceae bacterium]|nr:dipeptidyl carboxypeptidase II [Saprospiraceae bacterium]
MHKFMILAVLLFAVVSCNQKSKETEVKNNNTENPFFRESTPPYSAPDFSKIKDEHFKPALLEGMRQQTEAVLKIANDPEPATFENTILALEKSGELLSRTNNVFNALTAANTNETLKGVETELSPLFSKHSDEIYLNAQLFDRVKTVYAHRKELGLDLESNKLVENVYKDFVSAGANLTGADKEKLKTINGELATLSTKFNQVLREASDAATIEINDPKKLAGFSEKQLENIKDDKKDNTWLLRITNTTQQPQSKSLENRAIRQQLFEAGWNRTNGGKYDTRDLVRQMVTLRADKAKLLGFPNYASWRLQNTMAKKPEAVLDLFAQLVPAATAKARAEAADIQKMIKKTGGDFKLEPWDWNFYAEKVRKERYNLDEDEVKPYFE